MSAAAIAWTSWVLLLSAVITSVAAVLGLAARSYRDTLLENGALCALVITGAALVLQIYANGQALASSIAAYAASGAAYAIAQVFKERTRGVC